MVDCTFTNLIDVLGDDWCIVRGIEFFLNWEVILGYLDMMTLFHRWRRHALELDLGLFAYNLGAMKPKSPENDPGWGYALRLPRRRPIVPVKVPEGNEGLLTILLKNLPHVTKRSPHSFNSALHFPAGH